MYRVLLITFALFTLTGFTPPVEACGSGIHCRHADREERREDRRDDYDSDRDHEHGQCLDRVRGLGTQWVGTKGALDAAKKDWMERVRYDHGESFVDMTNAGDVESRCGRVSIGEVVGQVLYRCEIIARPCKAPMTGGER